MWKFDKAESPDLSYNYFFRWLTNSKAILKRVGIVNQSCATLKGTEHIVSNPRKIGNDLWVFNSKACAGCAYGASLISAKRDNQLDTKRVMKLAPYCAFLIDPIVVRCKETLNDGDIVRL